MEKNFLKAFEEIESYCGTSGFDTGTPAVRILVYNSMFEMYKATGGCSDPQNLTPSDREFFNIGMPYMHGGIAAAREAARNLNLKK